MISPAQFVLNCIYLDIIFASENTVTEKYYLLEGFSFFTNVSYVWLHY